MTILLTVYKGNNIGLSPIAAGIDSDKDIEYE
jgi:hypothetical protein